MGGLRIYDAMLLHTAASKVRRLHEEPAILRKEMAQFMEYIFVSSQRLEERITADLQTLAALPLQSSRPLLQVDFASLQSHVLDV